GRGDRVGDASRYAEDHQPTRPDHFVWVAHREFSSGMLRRLLDCGETASDATLLSSGLLLADPLGDSCDHRCLKLWVRAPSGQLASSSLMMRSTCGCHSFTRSLVGSLSSSRCMSSTALRTSCSPVTPGGSV